MNPIYVLLMMLFLHILDDFHLQGCLANLKQKSWWAVSLDEDKDFNKTWMEVWKGVPDDCYVWRCDCHT